MAAAVAMDEGDATDLDAYTMRVGLEAVLLQMSSGTAQAALVDQGAVFDFVALVPTPKAFVTQPVVRPIPWTVDGLLDATDMSRIEGGCGGGEGMGDMAAEAMVSIGVGEATCRLVEDELVVRELLTHVYDLSRLAYYLGASSAVADDFGMERVIAFLFHGPVDALGVGLGGGEEEFLPAVESWPGELIGPRVEVLGVDQATTSPSP